MNFTLKTLVAAVALVAASSANAYQNGNTGNGNLVFVLADTTTGNYMLSALTSNTVNDFVPTTTAVASSLNLSFNMNNSAAFTTFSAANADTSKWAWAVIAFDNTAPGANAGQQQVANGGRRYLMTHNNTKGAPAPTSTQFGGLLNNTAETNLSASVNEFIGSQGFGVTDTWGSRIPNGITNAYGTQSSFYYATGRSITALVTSIKDTTGADAKWSFGAGNVLTFTTAAVVPESDTYAMLLAGLGVMGMVARRRLAA